MDVEKEKMKTKIEKMLICLIGLAQKECSICGEWYGDICFRNSETVCDICYEKE